MTMRCQSHLYASVREWVGDDGRKHKRRIQVGVLMQDDRTGSQSIRIDLLPISRDWGGWLSVRPIKAEGAE